MPLFVSDIEYDAVRHDVSAVVARADEKVRELLIQVEVQKARADAAAINAEQTCALLEQKYLALAAEQSQLEQDKDQLASSLAERSAELAEAKSQAQQLQLEAVRRDGEAERHQVEIAELHRGKRELLELTEHKNAELDEKNSSIKAYLEKIVALTNERARVEAELLEERAEAARARAMQARLTQEKELLDQHNSWLNAELTTKSEALLEERRKSGEVEAELRTKLTEVDKNCKDASDMAKRLKDRVKDLENQLSQTREELKYVKDEAASQEEHFTGEIATASKLASLYKESSEGWSKKCNELEGVVKALETHLTQMETEYRLKLEKAVADKAAEAKVFSERISAIEKEAEEAKEELAQVRSQPELLSLAWRSPEGPSEPGEGQEPLVADFQEASFRSRVPEMSHAALAASLVREGWTLTTMYAKYQEAADAWRHEKQERLHAQSLLDRVYYEIEQKATVIIEEREKHFRMVQSYKIMEDKLKESAAFKGELEASLREAKALVRDREREIKSLEKEASDLLTQLAYLVKENAALGEGQGPSRVELELPIMPMSQGEESAADAVISGRLLTFKDAYDLVKINASLRRSLRDLALQNETKEEEIKKAFDEQLSKRNEANRKALLELKERMEQRDEAIKALKEQLAMYKRLYDDEVKIHSSQVLANGNGVEDGASPDYRRLFESVQEELQKLREETTQQAKALQKDVDKARDEASAARVERGKADGEARFAKEQYESLQRAMEDQRKEMEAVLSRNMEFSQLITDYQRKLREASQDVARAEDEARRKTIEASVLEREKELLISAETRASQEAKTLSERVHRLQAVLDTSQIAEQAREESKVAERQRHVAEAQRLQREWVESKKELEMERNHSRDLIIARDKAVAEVKAKLEAAEAACANAERACQETERRAKTAESRVEALQQELKEAEEKLAVLHAGTEDDSKDSETSDKEAQLSQLSAALARAKEDEAEAKEEAEALKDHVQQYKAIASANEEALKHVAGVNERLKTEMGRAQEQAAEKISTLKKHIEELEEDLSKTSSALSEVSQERERISQEAESEISSLKQTVASQRVEIEEARARINVLKQDVERHHKQWREAQNNYERQVMLQADTIRELSSASERLTRLEQVERAARARAETAEAELAALQVSWAAERAALESTRADAERKQRELEDQNSILLDRLEAKHVKSAEQSQRELAGNKELSTEHLVDTDADLEEVVRYLRRAKETADTELSLLKQERVRLQKQADAALRAAEDARTQLRVEQERNRASIQAEEEHRALVSQVQQLNLLRESNATLREENERNFREAKEWRDKAQKALAETDPLRGLLKEKDAELEAARKETLKIKEEVTLWQNRVKQLLEKYKSVDMEEYKQMRAELSSLKEHLKAVEQDIRSATAARAEAEEKLAKAEKELLNSASRLAEVEKELEACQASVKDLQIRLVNVRRAANKLQREKESVTKERDELKSTAEKATAAAEAALRDKGVSDAARQAAERHLKEDRLQAQSLKATAHAEALVDAQKEASAEAEILLRTEKEKVQKLEQEVQSWKHKDQRTKNNVLVAFQKAKSELDKLKNELKKIQAERDAYKHRIQQEGIQVGDQSESSGVPPDVTISADNAIAELEAFTKNEAEADLDTSLSLPNTSSPALNFGTTATTSRPGTPGNLIPAAASTGPENTAALGSQATASDMSLAAGEERQSQAASQSGAKIGQKVASGTATGTARSSAKSPVLAGVARPAPSSPAPVGSIALPPPAATALAGSGGLTSTSVTITTTTSTAASSGTVAAVGIVSSTVVSAAAAQARAVNLNQTQIDELRRKIKLAQHQEQMARTGTRRRLQRPPIEPPVSATSLATGAGMLDVESDLAVSGAGQATRKRPAGIESEVGGDLEGPGEKEDEGEVEGEPGPPSKRARPEDGELSAEEGEVQNEEFAAEETMSPLNEGLCKPSQDERDRSDDMEVPAQKRSRLDEPGAEERIDLGAREYCEENQGAEEVAKVDRDSTDGMEQDGMMSPVAAGCGPGGGERTVSTTTQVGEVETEAARQGMETLAEEKEAGETRDDGDQEEQAVVEGQEMVRERTPAAQVAAGEDEEEGDVRHSAGEPESDSGESLVFVEDSEIAGSDAEDNATEMTVDHSTEGVEHTDGHQESQDNGEPQSEGEVNLPRSQDGGDTGEGEEGSAIAKTPVRSTRAAVRAALGLRAGRGRGREGAHSPGIARGRGEQSGTGNAVGETESATRSRIINLRARRSTETSSSSRQGTSRGAVPTEPAGAGRAQPGRGAKQVRRTGPAAASRRRVTSQGTGSSTPAFGSGAVGGGDSSAAPANTEPVPTGNMYALLDENNE